MNSAGRVPEFLMCPPTLYEVDYVINPWMVGNVHAASRERAETQWKALYDTLCGVARVQLIEPEPGSPDMVFTANAGLACEGTVVLSRFRHPERQGEEPHFRRWFEAAGYRVHDLPRATPFEGEGDALFTCDGGRLWVGHGPRTAIASHDHLHGLWAAEVVSLHLVDPRFYHLDTCFAPLTGGFLLFYPPAFDADSLALIEAFYPPARRIAVTEEDAIRFACNVVDVDRSLILNRISEALADQLTVCGFDLVQLDLSEFLKAGGAAKCLTLRLGR